MFKKFLFGGIAVWACLVASQSRAAEAFHCQPTNGEFVTGLTVRHLASDGQASVFRILGRVTLAYNGTYTKSIKGSSEVYTYDLMSNAFEPQPAKLVVTVTSDFEPPPSCGRGACRLMVLKQTITAEFENANVEESFVCN